MHAQIIVQDEALWLQYFSQEQAMQALADHVNAQPGARTPERHTAKAYRLGLKSFMEFAGSSLPTPDLMREYIAHLVGRGLKTSTISAKYLAPARHYLKFLANQSIRVTGAEREFVSDCKEQLRLAADVKPPRKEITSYIGQMWHYNPLNLAQVRALLEELKRDERLGGIRDYALFTVAFATALRLNELAQITLNNIKPVEGGYYTINVRRKRNNIDPVVIKADVYQALMDWVYAYNEAVGADDPRRIEGDRPLWQPLTHSTTPYSRKRVQEADAKIQQHYEEHNIPHPPLSAMNNCSLSRLINRRSEQFLGEEYRITPHDTRRTTLRILNDLGKPITTIQRIAGHQDPHTTWGYLRDKPNFEDLCVGNMVDLI